MRARQAKTANNAKKAPRKRNPVARQLRLGAMAARIVKPKKGKGSYSRKGRRPTPGNRAWAGFTVTVLPIIVSAAAAGCGRFSGGLPPLAI
jgi:stalled ribosome alternative rescue factor ArfA